MSPIRTILRELFGLFVDDGLFALAILAWVALVWLAASTLGPGSSGIGILFFAGLAAILIWSAVRRARP